MRALVYDEYTIDDDFSKILKIKNLPKPEPRSNEVVFKVISAALNYDDIWGMRGKPLAIPLPHISGTDAAGEVVAIGSDVKNIKVGDRVVSHGNMSCRVCKSCTAGREFNCKKRTIWGFETGPLWGGHTLVKTNRSGEGGNEAIRRFTKAPAPHLLALAVLWRCVCYRGICAKISGR